ncbi:unnamed protein product [Oppiella nova]|uniref:Uncharacterized protein n=1 Tax=Oppiella nova TaxID=334625 RepID=A0A7R9LH15_9ACAR|nr:unnamed protein product [Oppiella nova]CAG2162871.1 unnamed protein product [Oppiella nova]
MLGPIGPIQMHNSVLNPHLIDNSIAADYDNIAFSVPHLYYNPRHIKQEVVSESDCQPSVPQNCHFPFFNKSRMSYDSNRILNSSANSMYSVKKAALVWPGAPDGGVHGKSTSGAGIAGIGGGAVNTPPVSGPTSGRPVSPNSGLVHWVSVMADHAHVPSPAHSASQHVDSASVHYMWNGGLEELVIMSLLNPFTRNSHVYDVYDCIQRGND